MALAVKSPSVNAGDRKDADSVPGFPGGGTDNPLQYSKIPWTEPPGGQQSMGLQ